MKKIALGILVGVVIAVLTVGVASALPSNKGSKGPPEFVPELSESELTKIVFIRYAPGFPRIKPAKPACGDEVTHPSEQCGEPDLPECPAGSVCINCKCIVEEEVEPTTACYAFLSGAKPRWNWVEPYVYNDASLEGPTSDAVNIWGASVSDDIFGTGSYGTGYDWGDYDYTNSISFGDYPKEGVLAVAAIWFRGKNIYEYDIMFDTDYSWGDALADPNVFDLPTVTLHEFGHGAGLDDIYDVDCEGNVMYWQYKGVKRALAGGDTTGIQTLYGSK